MGRRVTKRVLAYILKQVQKAGDELDRYQPTEIDWRARANATCRRLVPWLSENANDLCKYVDGVMNSPSDVRRAANELLRSISEYPDFAAAAKIQRTVALLKRSLDSEELLISNAGGTVVSKLIERYLIEASTNWSLDSNGASDYPDLFIQDADYSRLPRFVKKSDQTYGAALKGKQRRPVRVPDGLEIKTCKGSFAVDCHHAHTGLHLVLLFEKTRARFATRDVQIGFMRHELYRITKPASPTTTLKASFNGDHFVSLLDRDDTSP